MKTIAELWAEYVANNQPEFKLLPYPEIINIRNAFYAGFNRCYNSLNENSVFFVAKYESEMDAANEGKYGVQR